MRIKVKTHGHQHYHETEGEVLQWCHAVEVYETDGKTQPMQVPAVLIDTGIAVMLVPLQRQLYWTEIEVLPSNE